MRSTLLIALVFLLGFSSAQIVQDGSIETAPGSGIWEDHSDSFGTVICDTSCGFEARTGAQYAWFLGIETPETAYLQQMVDLPLNHELHFWWIVLPSAAINPVFQVELDGHVVQSWDL